MSISLMAFLSFVLCIFFIEESYAKYVTATSENAEINVARWRILVNNNDIRDNNSTNTTITPIFPNLFNIPANIPRYCVRCN